MLLREYSVKNIFSNDIWMENFLKSNQGQQNLISALNQIAQVF